jgi:hypothetical protein
VLRLARVLAGCSVDFSRGVCAFLVVSSGTIATKKEVFVPFLTAGTKNSTRFIFGKCELLRNSNNSLLFKMA